MLILKVVINFLKSGLLFDFFFLGGEVCILLMCGKFYFGIFINYKNCVLVLIGLLFYYNLLFIYFNFYRFLYFYI